MSQSDADDLWKIPAALLAWYDAHARVLPWRVGPAARARGVAPDPYRVWLSEVMLQQTTVATVTPRFERFLARWPTVEALASAPLEDVLGEWAGLGYYARARNLHRCAGAVAERGGFPEDAAALETLPGIGRYTAAAIAAIAFDEHATVIDGNVERVVARLFLINGRADQKSAVRAAADAIWPRARSGDFAQALMDLGAGVCRPRGPRCADCPLVAFCAAHAMGDPGAVPRRAEKAPRPTRRGDAFALFNAEGAAMFVRRPPRGLLGGMLALPGSDWTDQGADDPMASAPRALRWRRAGVADHTFTHFRLYLQVFAATTRGAPRAGETWLSPQEAALPTVMRKALDLALAATADRSPAMTEETQ